MGPLYLVDASLYVFRAWHSMPDEFHDDQGQPVAERGVGGDAQRLAALVVEGAAVGAGLAAGEDDEPAVQLLDGHVDGAGHAGAQVEAAHGR